MAREMTKKISFRQKVLLLTMLLSRILLVLGFIVIFGFMIILDTESINAILGLGCGLTMAFLGMACEVFAVVVLMKKNERIKTVFDFNIYDGKSYSNYMLVEVKE